MMADKFHLSAGHKAGTVDTAGHSHVLRGVVPISAPVLPNVLSEVSSTQDTR